ncbi:hypothetical protein ACIQI7_38605 [Kitasatospora sp. NPDC092039]|uniref:hypothetical protein n=1 Tax=Kitasatospora sp. NPDC092039 TaxID=3364086 RepID=UPI0037F477A8
MDDTNGVHCGGVDCHGRHHLPEPWDETQRRAREKAACIDKGRRRPAGPGRAFTSRTNPDDRTADAYGDDYGGPRLDW